MVMKVDIKALLKEMDGIQKCIDTMSQQFSDLKFETNYGEIPEEVWDFMGNLERTFEEINERFLHFQEWFAEVFNEVMPSDQLDLDIEVVEGEEVAEDDKTFIESKTNLKDVLEYRSSDQKRNGLTVTLGTNEIRETVSLDITRQPQILIGGATESGKTSLIRSIIAQLVHYYTPEELRLVLMDPKMVEFTDISGLENYYFAKYPKQADPILDDIDSIMKSLEGLRREMNKRYEMLKGANVRNIDEYNANTDEILPYIVVCIDEYSDVLMVKDMEFKVLLAGLAQKGCAVGIHLIASTMRAWRSSMTGLIKANFPTRIAFRTLSATESRTILDEYGAEYLDRQEEFLIRSMDFDHILKLKAIVATDADVAGICNEFMS